jgi:hypothetical protein
LGFRCGEGLKLSLFKAIPNSMFGQNVLGRLVVFFDFFAEMPNINMYIIRILSVFGSPDILQNFVER